MSLVTLTINSKKIEVEKGSTILDAAKLLNIQIPTLCHMKLHDGVENKPGACRVCMVEVEGRKNLATACSTEVTENMVVITNSKRAAEARKTSVELLLSDHPKDCLVCEKNGDCELENLAVKLGIREIRYTGEISTYKKDTSSYSLVRDPDKCILCRRCETVCRDIQSVSILAPLNRGFKTILSPAFGEEIFQTKCVNCGQCAIVCPTGALTEVNNTAKVWAALNNKDKHVIVQTAPSVRAALGEEFGLEAGKAVTGKMVAALRALGFHKVFDTDFAADLTIMEEASELIHRVQNNGTFPMITSCCPGWIKFIEQEYPDLLEHPSTCKSPQQMFGAIAKSYYAKKIDKDPKDIILVSVMPCLAKKFEAARPEMAGDVDIVISTRELAKMIKQAGIDFSELQDENYDRFLGESTGAAAIFGVTGGVMEAALRTAYEWITKENLDNVDLEIVRGMEGIREAAININGLEVKAAIVHGLGNAKKIMDKVRTGQADYHMIEVMACPGGCIDGAGQPYHHGDLGLINKRAGALYEEDKSKTIRKSHDNPEIIELYEEYLGRTNSSLSHKLLHTKYVKRDI